MCISFGIQYFNTFIPRFLLVAQDGLNFHTAGARLNAFVDYTEQGEPGTGHRIQHSVSLLHFAFLKKTKTPSF